KDRLEEIYGIFKQGFNEFGLDKAFGNFSAFAKSSRDAQAEALTRMIDALRINPLTGGYDICHWNDASFEFPFGLVDEWRDPKPSLAAAPAANKPLHLIVSTAQSNFYAGEPLEGELVIVNDEGRSGKAEANLEVTSKDGKVWQKQTRPAVLGTRVQSLGNFRLTAPFAEGTFRLRASLNVDGKLVDQTAHSILILKRINPRTAAESVVEVLDPDGRMTGHLNRLPIKVSAYSADSPPESVYMVGPLAESLYDYPLGAVRCLAELAHRGATLI